LPRSNSPFAVEQSDVVEAALNRFSAQYPQLNSIYWNLVSTLGRNPGFVTMAPLSGDAIPGAKGRRFAVTQTPQTALTPAYRVLLEFQPANTIYIWALSRL
jgi:hypothetical protein